MFASLQLPALLTIFGACAGVIWFAGVQLADTTDILSSRFNIGAALGGIIILAVTTNLPEIAITISASLAGELGVAVGNILGGIAIQTVVLAIMDMAMTERIPYHNGSKATASAVRMVPDAGFCCVAQALNTTPLTRSERENKDLTVLMDARYLSAYSNGQRG